MLYSKIFIDNNYCHRGQRICSETINVFTPENSNFPLAGMLIN